jgi:hypothetical protein
LCGPRWLVSLGTTVALLVPGVLGAHGGGLDAYGCHHNRKLEYQAKRRAILEGL